MKPGDLKNILFWKLGPMGRKVILLLVVVFKAMP